MITDAAFWSLEPEEREEQIPALDPHCLVCGESFEGESFIWELFMGPQLDAGGMHLFCAYTLSMGFLRDLATEWRMDTGAARRFFEQYNQDLQARAAHTPDDPDV